jgi:chemotaxis protein methyltransferase CheR
MTDYREILSAPQKRQLFQWIEAQTGLQTNPQNEDQVLLALKLQAKQHNLPHDLFVAALLQEKVARQPFIDAVTTHESYFMRHRRQMELAIEQLIRPLLLKGQRPRILSAPCAQGEEPYSLAMLLLESNINPSQVEIIGVDIAACSIADARAGLYGDYPLHKLPGQWRQQYFVTNNRGHQLIPLIRQSVRLHRLNLLDNALQPLGPGFDLIFSNNLLIYLSSNASERLIRVFSSLLREGGVLMVDPVESTRPAQLMQPLQLNEIRCFQNRADGGTGGTPPPNNMAISHRQLPEANAATAETVDRERNATTLYGEAISAYHSRRLDLSIKLFEQLAAYPAWVCYAALGRARVLLQMGDTLKALHEAERAIAEKERNTLLYLLPEDEADAHAIAAEVLQQLQRHDDEARHLEQLRRLNPLHPLLR